MPARMMMFTSCLALASTALAQGDRSSSSTTHTSSHRVVVKDGKTLVDEKTVDGKPVDGRAAPAPAPALPIDLQEMLDRVRRGLPLDVGLPPGDGARASSSHTRRVVVENGVVVVDEETRDGVPVRGGRGGAAPHGERGEARADAHAEAHAEAHSESHDENHRDGRGKASGKGDRTATGGAADRPLPPPVDFTPVPPARTRLLPRR